MAAKGKGVFCALGAYLLWGFLPVYWKLLDALPASEILAQRMIWSFIFLALLTWMLKERKAPPERQRSIRRTEERSPHPANLRTALPLLVAALLLAINWLTYIWAVNADRIVETSLGYYINPLVSVALGVAVLRERLRRLQWAAIGLAASGVAYLTVRYGSLPWVALVLAFTFGLYGLAKKQTSWGPLRGLTLETALMVLPAMLYLSARSGSVWGILSAPDVATRFLLVLTGVVTALPLLLFAQAAKRLDLSLLGLLQYVAPTCGLLLGVLVYGEPFGRDRRIGFTLIWLALILYWLEGAIKYRTTSLPADQ
jgi:chloramphenicol-sensitive protein RarD